MLNIRKLDDGPARSFCFYLETYSLGKRDDYTKMSMNNLQDLMIAFSVSTIGKELLAFTFSHLRMFTLKETEAYFCNEKRPYVLEQALYT